MDAALKKKLDKISKQLDKDQQMALQGELAALIAKYQGKVKKKSVPLRKITQYENTKQKFNDWVDKEVERKAEYSGVKHLSKTEKYKELTNSKSVPHKEMRSHKDVVGNSADPLGEVNHAINRMKNLMSQKGQKEKLDISKEAFRKAFNVPTGGAVDKQLAKALKGMSAEEWEHFNAHNKDLIKKVWEWYKKLMEMMKDPNFMLGRHTVPSIPTMLLDMVLTEIDSTKATVRAKNRAKARKNIKRTVKREVRKTIQRTFL